MLLVDPVPQATGGSTMPCRYQALVAAGTGAGARQGSLSQGVPATGEGCRQRSPHIQQSLEGEGEDGVK